MDSGWRPDGPDSSLTSLAENSAQPANNSAGLDTAQAIVGGPVARMNAVVRWRGDCFKEQASGQRPWVSKLFERTSGIAEALPFEAVPASRGRKLNRSHTRDNVPRLFLCLKPRRRQLPFASHTNQTN